MQSQLSILEQKGLLITQGLEVMPLAKLAFLFNQFMVEAQMDLDKSLRVAVYQKIAEHGLWINVNRTLVLATDSMQSAIDFITQCTQRLYGVSGNLDQIMKFPELCAFDFKPVGQRMPNRAVTYFADKHSAKELYQAMQRLEIVAFKDWID
jgi:hypothetical protein